VHLTSVDLDGTVNFWNVEGLLIHTFSATVPIQYITASGSFAFICTEPTQIRSINLEVPEFPQTVFTLPSPLKYLTLIADGLAGFAVLADHSVCVISASEVIHRFKFPQTDTVVTVLPLNLEGATGLITYAAQDQQGKVTLRALKKVLEEVTVPGQITLIADSRLSIVVRQDREAFVYDRDHLTTHSMEIISELRPKQRLSNFFTRIGVA
jgi:hypothetical protein